MYKGGRLTIIDVLLTADDLTGITRQLDFYRLIAEADAATVERMDQLASDVAALGTVDRVPARARADRRARAP